MCDAMTIVMVMMAVSGSGDGGYDEGDGDDDEDDGDDEMQDDGSGGGNDDHDGGGGNDDNDDGDGGCGGSGDDGEDDDDDDDGGSSDDCDGGHGNYDDDDDDDDGDHDDKQSAEERGQKNHGTRYTGAQGLQRGREDGVTCFREDIHIYIPGMRLLQNTRSTYHICLPHTQSAHHVFTLNLDGCRSAPAKRAERNTGHRILVMVGGSFQFSCAFVCGETTKSSAESG